MKIWWSTDGSNNINSPTKDQDNFKVQWSQDYGFILNKTYYLSTDVTHYVCLCLCCASFFHIMAESPLPVILQGIVYTAGAKRT